MTQISFSMKSLTQMETFFSPPLDPSEWLENTEILIITREEISKLKPNQRIAFTLKYNEVEKRLSK